MFQHTGHYYTAVKKNGLGLYVLTWKGVHGQIRLQSTEFYVLPPLHKQIETQNLYVCICLYKCGERCVRIHSKY